MLSGLFHAIFIIIVWEPNYFEAKRVHTVNHFGSYQVKIEESE